MAKRALIDTNVWLSALYFAGKPSQIVSLIEDKKLISVTSLFILSELKDKMINTFDTPSFYAAGTASYIQSISQIVPLKGLSFKLRDPADNQILETAVVGKCSWIITGDKDLLTIKKFEQIKIVTPNQFLNT